MKKTLRLLAALALGAASVAPSLHAAESRPNIIFLFADDLAANAVGYSGNKDVITPHIDKLAQDGVRFMSHYDTTSICMASRVSVLTGLYEYRHGCNFSHGDLERRFIEKSYPVMLRKAGYFTGFAGKLGFDLQGEKFDVFAPMFDQWAGGPGQTLYATAKNEGIAKYAAQYPHSSRAYGAWAQDFLKSAKASTIPRFSAARFRGSRRLGCSKARRRRAAKAKASPPTSRRKRNASPRNEPNLRTHRRESSRADGGETGEASPLMARKLVHSASAI